MVAHNGVRGDNDVESKRGKGVSDITNSDEEDEYVCTQSY